MIFHILSASIRKLWPPMVQRQWQVSVEVQIPSFFVEFTNGSIFYFAMLESRVFSYQYASVELFFFLLSIDLMTI